MTFYEGIGRVLIWKSTGGFVWENNVASLGWDIMIRWKLD